MRYKQITFSWNFGGGCVILFNKSIEESMRIARLHGYREPCWYKPLTWWNRIEIID
jgi:hypothetical protein